MYRASDILCGHGATKFRWINKISRNSQKHMKYLLGCKWSDCAILTKANYCLMSWYIIELFWKNGSYVSGVRVCIFVALYVRMFVARAKVEGTMSWCLGTYEILASIKHAIAKSRTRALWDRHLDSSQFFRLLLWLQVFRSITLNIFMIQMPCTVMQLFKGSYLILDAASRHFWPNSAIVNGTMHVFMSSVSPASR